MRWLSAAREQLTKPGYTLDQLTDKWFAKKDAYSRTTEMGSLQTRDDLKAFLKKQLAAGVEVEKEHTDLVDIAEVIASRHLDELPNYYTLLKTMEESGKSALEPTTIGG